VFRKNVKVLDDRSLENFRDHRSQGSYLESIQGSTRLGWNLVRLLEFHRWRTDKRGIFSGTIMFAQLGCDYTCTHNL